MTREELDAYARELVAEWPPLSDEQRERLRVLLRPQACPERRDRAA